MTDSDRKLIRARYILVTAWWLSLEVAARRYWIAADDVAVNGIALAWRDCDQVMGVS
jgi:hypothetical protein